MVPLVLLDSECSGHLLHPLGPWPLYCGCVGGLLSHNTPLLVVPHPGQPAGRRLTHTSFITFFKKSDDLIYSVKFHLFIFCFVVIQALKEISQCSLLSRVWRYQLFQYFEENVKGIVLSNYQLPWSSWRSSSWSRGVKYSRLDTLWPRSSDGWGRARDFLKLWYSERKDGVASCHQAVLFTCRTHISQIPVQLARTVTLVLL